MRKLGNLYENEMIFFFSNFACDNVRENRFAMQRGFWIVGETCFYFLRELAGNLKHIAKESRCSRFQYC